MNFANPFQELEKYEATSDVVLPLELGPPEFRCYIRSVVQVPWYFASCIVDLGRRVALEPPSCRPARLPPHIFFM